MAERYLIGNMEEHTDGADVISSTSPLGAALVRCDEGPDDHLRRADRAVDGEGARRRAGLSRWPPKLGVGRVARPRSSPRRCHPGGSSSSTTGARCWCVTSAANRERRSSCCSTAGRRPPTSTGSGATRRSASTIASSRSTTVATAPASGRRRRSGSRTAPTTSSTSAPRSASTASWPSATPWVGRSPNSCGAATPTT